jgi:hypothetical protein
MHQTLDNDDSSNEKEIKDDDSEKKMSISLIDVEQEPIRIDTVFDPWDDTKVRQLFLPDAGEHPKDAIAQHIDILMDARTEPEGYKSIIEGGDKKPIDYFKCMSRKRSYPLGASLHYLVPGGIRIS